MNLILKSLYRTHTEKAIRFLKSLLGSEKITIVLRITETVGKSKEPLARDSFEMKNTNL